MRVVVNGKEQDVEPGTRLSDLVETLEETLQDEPMISSLRRKTGESQLTFIHNDRVVASADYDAIEIQEDDQVMMIHPFFGG
jgi:sulfur carrier protein ThiS